MNKNHVDGQASLRIHFLGFLPFWLWHVLLPDVGGLGEGV